MPRERAAEKGAWAPHLRPGPWIVGPSGCPPARGPHLADVFAQRRTVYRPPPIRLQKSHLALAPK